MPAPRAVNPRVAGCGRGWHPGGRPSLRLRTTAEDQVRGTLGLGGGDDDRARVLLETLEPTRHVRGLVLDRGAGYSALGAEKRGAHLGDELLPRVVGGSEGRDDTGYGEPTQPARMARAVNQLVKQSRVVGLGAFEGRRRRHRHPVGDRGVARSIESVLDSRGAGVTRDDGPAVEDLAIGKSARFDDARREAVALLDVEDRVVAQHESAPPGGRCLTSVGRVAIVIGPAVVAIEDSPEDAGHALLALADRSAELLGLPEGEPRGPRVAGRLRGDRQQEVVDAAVDLAGAAGSRRTDG